MFFFNSNNKNETLIKDDSLRNLKRAVALFVIGITPAFIFAMAYWNRFLPGTEVELKGSELVADVSGKTPEEAMKLINSELSELEFTVRGRDSEKNFRGEELGLRAESSEALTAYLEDNRFNIALSFKEPTGIDMGVVYDESLFEAVSEGLSESDTPVFPKAAYVSDYEKGKGYSIVPEVKGNILKTGAFRAFLKEEISRLETDIEIPDSLYKSKRLNSDSKLLRDKAERLNSLADRSIFIRFGEINDRASTPSEAETGAKSYAFEEELSGEELSRWIVESPGGEVRLSEEMIEGYIAGITERLRAVNVPGVSGETKIIADETSLAELLRETLTQGAPPMSDSENASTPSEAGKPSESESGENEGDGPRITELTVPQREVHKDYDPRFGELYVEVWLAGQRVRLYEHGNVTVETPCVTGSLARGDATPPGIFSIYYKQRNRVLRGEKLPDGSYSYESPVSFWMPFNGGIGLHDATWRGSFGGNIYRTSGSHGCINMPYNAAKTIYEKVEAGTTVYVY